MIKSELENKTKFNRKLFVLALVALEIVACYYAYYTLGEVKQFFCVLIFSLNIFPFLLYLFKMKRIALILGLAIGFLLIPYQSFLFIKWIDLKKESSLIVKYLYGYQKNNGEFPQNISDYEFKNHNLIDNISYNTGAKGFRLHYYVGTKGTTHFYYHRVGKWEYYPD